MSPGIIAALASAIDEVVAGLSEVERGVEGATVELRRAGRPFVRIEPDGVSFRIGERVVGAARRTPGVLPSALGRDWAVFRPTALDRFALDRATSWTELAWRVAGE